MAGAAPGRREVHSTAPGAGRCAVHTRGGRKWRGEVELFVQWGAANGQEEGRGVALLYVVGRRCGLCSWSRLACC